MQPHPPARTKEAMIGFFQDRMQSGVARYAGEKKQNADEGAAKTYMLETDLTGLGDNRHDRTLAFLRGALAPLHCEIQELHDETFFLITRRNARGEAARQDQFYLQADDDRFWFIHTLAKSERADRLHQELIRLPKVDSAWFPTEFLLDLTRARDNIFRGFSSRFDNAPFAQGDEDRRAEFSLKLWGKLAPTVLDAINQSDVLRQHIAVSGVRVHHRPASEDMVLDDVNCFGKVTAFGASFNSHYDLMAYQLRPAYRQTIVDRIEGELAIGVGDDHQLTGAPIIVRHYGLEQPIEQFVRAIFNGAGPFRLWGLASMILDDCARVYAVDMHVGHKLTFDLSPTIIRIELPKGSCGNTIARFFTLFQQHYAANATISGGRFDAVFRLREDA